MVKKMYKKIMSIVLMSFLLLSVVMIGNEAKAKDMYSEESYLENQGLVEPALGLSNMEIPSNGKMDYAVDDLGAKAGSEIRVLNMGTGQYEQVVGVVSEDGHYSIEGLKANKRYCIEFPYDGTTEAVSPVVPDGNQMWGDGRYGHVTIDTKGYEEGQTAVVNGAVYDIGVVAVRFTTDGLDSIGEVNRVRLQVPTVYEAVIGEEQDVERGIFVLPKGYSLAAGEASQKVVELTEEAPTGEIIFKVVAVQPGLTIQKENSRSQELLEIGDRIVYTIELVNDTERIQRQIKIEDAVPANTYFISASDGVQPVEGRLEWMVDALDVGERVEVSFVVQVEKNKEKVGRWEVVSNQGMVNGVAVNNTRNIVVQAVLDSLQKSDTLERTEVKRGQILTYAIEIENSGEGRGRQIEVVDEIPAYTQYIEGTLKGSPGIYEKGKVIFTIRELDPGEKQVLEFKVRVN